MKAETKLGLLQLAKQLGNLSQACKIMGYRRDSFYSLQELYETGGEIALQEISRRKPIPKNRVDPHIEEAAVQLAFDQPAFVQVRGSKEMRKKGIFISSAGGRCVWQWHDLETFQRLTCVDTVVFIRTYSRF